MKNAALFIGVGVLLVSAGYGSWLLQKRWNYSFAYEQRVVETVEAWVKENRERFCHED